jgi:hypothetical protein
MGRTMQRDIRSETPGVQMKFAEPGRLIAKDVAADDFLGSQ